MGSNPWFRMYAEFANDPKVQMLSEAMQRRLVMLFCFRCNGDVTLHDSEVTFLLRISDAEWAETKAVFLAKGFIDEANNILNWDKRQYRSDSSRERVARYREKAKQADVTPCNVTVTPPDTDTDTEQKKETTLRSVSSAPRRKPERISFDFEKGRFSKIPRAELLLWQTAYPALSIETEISKAAAWLLANPNNKKSNYERFLVNWFSKAQDRAPSSGGKGAGPPSMPMSFEQRDMADYEQRKARKLRELQEQEGLSP